MFPAIEKELSKNEFFKAWKEKSIFEQLIGLPPVIYEEFSEEWVHKLTEIIGEGPISLRFFANLGLYLEEVRKLEGYQHVKKKLQTLDENFYPTLSEIEFIDFLLQFLPPTSIHLEYTFQTAKGKHPELMIDSKSGPVYFDVTRIMDYKEMSAVLGFCNIISAFQLSLRILKNLNRKISANFNELPNEDTIKDALFNVNSQLQKGSYLFELKSDSYSIAFSEGDEVAVSIPGDVIEKKLKNKLDKEATQFDEDACNFVVIDVTPAIWGLDDLSRMARSYFDYSGNTVIWGVFLISKKWAIEDPSLTFKTETLSQPNLKGRNKDLAIKIIHELFALARTKMI